MDIFSCGWRSLSSNRQPHEKFILSTLFVSLEEVVKARLNPCSDCTFSLDSHSTDVVCRRLVKKMVVSGTLFHLLVIETETENFTHVFSLSNTGSHFVFLLKEAYSQVSIVTVQGFRSDKAGDTDN